MHTEDNDPFNPDWVLPAPPVAPTPAPVAGPDPDNGNGPGTRPARVRGVAAALALVMTGTVGGAVSAHALWGPQASTAAVPSGSQIPSRQGPGTSPVQPASPFGGTTGGGTADSAGSGPSDAASIARNVDPGVVDINTTLGYANARAAGTGMVLTS